MNFIKLTLFDLDKPVYINMDTISYVHAGTKYNSDGTPITLVGLANGDDHFQVNESVDNIISTIKLYKFDGQ